MRRPNLNALTMFDAAARHLNFRLAAEEMNLTQGAVAQQVRRLESELDVVLFNRLARGLSLTDTGKKFHASIRQALNTIGEATRQLQTENTRVTISMTPSFASKWLVPRLGSFSIRHPEIEVNTIATEALANFESDGVDIAIRQSDHPPDDNLHSDLLAPLALCAVCSPGYMDSSEKVTQFQHFSSHTLLQDSHRHWDFLVSEFQIAPQRRIRQFNQTALAVDAAIHGQGVALAPLLLLQDSLEQGQLVDLWRDTRRRDSGFFIVRSKKRPLSDAQSIFVNWMISEIRTSG